MHYITLINAYIYYSHFPNKNLLHMLYSLSTSLIFTILKLFISFQIEGIYISNHLPQHMKHYVTTPHIHNIHLSTSKLSFLITPTLPY